MEVPNTINLWIIDQSFISQGISDFVSNKSITKAWVSWVCDHSYHLIHILIKNKSILFYQSIWIHIFFKLL